MELEAILLPADQFAHKGAPTEWWWHVGTLRSEDGRIFGFEVNATGMQSNENEVYSYAFTQIEITDVNNQQNYQKVTPITPLPSDWAQYDSSKPWHVKLGESGQSGSVSMTAIDDNPLNMSVHAEFLDIKYNVPCTINLTLLQQGPPLLVWGTGCKLVNPEGKTSLTQNNYYYSLTNLRASGSLKIGDDIVKVTGTTWMDHEYGFFANGSNGDVIWTLQDIQFDNGLHLSNYTAFGQLPQENIPMLSTATLLVDGRSIYVNTITTPMGPLFKTNKGEKEETYFMTFKIEIDGYKNISFLVHSAYDDQVFRDGKSADVYEGMGTAKLIIDLPLLNQMVVSSGTAWIEQNLGMPK